MEAQTVDDVIKEFDPVAKLRPMWDFIVVSPDKIEEGLTQSGIVTPALPQGQIWRGTVLKIGPLRKETRESCSIDLSEGDKVLFSKHAAAGQLLVISGTHGYVLLQIQQIMAVDEG